MDLNDKQLDQVTRLLLKLEDVSMSIENEITSMSKYKWNAPVMGRELLNFEEKYNVNLPEHYKIFMGFISDGAPFIEGELYRLDEVRVVGELNHESLLYPHMESGTFDTFIRTLEKELKRDSETLAFNGLLIIGEDNDGNDIALVVTGVYRGRLIVINTKSEDPFIFSYNLNFLDLYERWIDVLLKNRAVDNVLIPIQETPINLCETYSNTSDKHYKMDVALTLGTYVHLEEKEVEFLKTIIVSETDLVLKTELLKVVKKFDETFVISHLNKHLYSNDIDQLEHFIRSESDLYIFNEDDYKRLVYLLTLFAEHVQWDEVSTFELIVKMLNGSDYNKFEVLTPYLNHPKANVRAKTVSLIVNVKDFRENKNELVSMLDDDVLVVREVVNVLINSTMSDEYLRVFESVVTTHANDDYILSLIERYLHKIKVDLDYYAS